MLREILEGDPEIAGLREKIRSLPEDATYYHRVRLGELVVQALEDRRDVEARRHRRPARAVRGDDRLESTRRP